MNFVTKKRIKLEFVIQESVAVGLSDLEDFLRNLTNHIKVEEYSYLSEVLSESSEETPGSSESARKYNKRARPHLHNQASKELSNSSKYRGYYGLCDQNSVVSDATEISDLSEYSSSPPSVVNFPVSKSDGETLGSKDSTRSADSRSEDLSFISYSEAFLNPP